MPADEDNYPSPLVSRPRSISGLWRVIALAAGLHHRRRRHLDAGRIHPAGRHPDLRGPPRGGRRVLPVCADGRALPLCFIDRRDADAVAGRGRQPAVRRRGVRSRRQDQLCQRAIWRTRRRHVGWRAGGRSAPVRRPAGSGGSRLSPVARGAGWSSGDRGSAADRRARRGRWVAATSRSGTASRCGRCRRSRAAASRWCCGRWKTSRAIASGRTMPFSNCSAPSTISTTRRPASSPPTKAAGCNISTRPSRTAGLRSCGVRSGHGAACRHRAGRRREPLDARPGRWRNPHRDHRYRPRQAQRHVDPGAPAAASRRPPRRWRAGRDADAGARPPRRRAGRGSAARLRNPLLALFQRHALCHRDARPRGQDRAHQRAVQPYLRLVGQ